MDSRVGCLLTEKQLSCSAGGNLAIAVSLAVRARGAYPAPVAAVLIYPATDLKVCRRSYIAYANEPPLARTAMIAYCPQPVLRAHASTFVC